MPSVIHQPHDKFFKLSLGQLPVAQEFFRAHLPAAVLEKINLEALKLELHSFIDENYKGTEADVVYSAQVDNAPAYLYVLCEHQSTIDRWIAFRLWVYMIRLLERHRQHYPDQPLPLIYPLVVYTGEEPWSAPLDIFSLFEEHDNLAKEWLLQPFQLLDIHQIKDDEIRRKQWCGLVEFALKYKQARDFKQFLKILLPWLRQVERDQDTGFFLSKIVLKYVLDGMEAQEVDLFIKGVQEYLSPELGGEIMTLAQQLKQQGVGNLMIHQLKRRFKQIPDFYLTRITQADSDVLLLWGERILDAQSIEEVFEKI